MNFYKTSTDKEIVDYLADTISNKLTKNQRVLWLLSGGSAIAVETHALKRLAKTGKLSNLGIGLVDERYGAPDHADSNWYQLNLSGQNLPEATLLPVLSGDTLQATADNYQAAIEHQLARADYVIGVAGIGADGHTFGIKPGSPALSNSNLVAGYSWDDYVRITLTANAIKKMDEVVVYAMGREKKEQLLNLKEDLPAAIQPAQLLKLCPKLSIFNDQIN